MPKLGVNIDHVATVRQARRTFEPDPVWAAALAQLGGADGITVHLREDRRHIQDRDVKILLETVTVKLNLECSCADEIISLACNWKPQQVCLVPERRAEITTEGGLDVVNNSQSVGTVIKRLHDCGIEVSLFVDANEGQVTMAAELGADAVELHTGKYAMAQDKQGLLELELLQTAARQVLASGMQLHAGHGLTYDNVLPVASIPGMQELNIGHSIVSRSIMVGFTEAVREMKRLITLDR
ncbi:MAG TPA: pyridoxine 5'-phosphate synthase [Pirellulaceae bacterium]|nr:pyridoxine 5'-phosphate synthase [Pirellulaceae bacterium]HMO92702.1 pyridoxine 5'-phosphate synthase [Pirellulaceae bacterium]HMP70377.1 pyridoxine 5'-phosphate synthase [Pirellulaceae bacterium]